MRSGSSDPLWLLGDHLGSTSKVVYFDGLTEHSQQLYKPWGEKRYPTGAPTLPTTFRYTGQRSETGLGPSGGEGLMYYGARWYDSSAGRFIQADTIVPGGVQGLDRYAYVNNSPVNYTDPSGHCLPNQCGYTHDGDEAFSPISDLIKWRKHDEQATFTDENWFSDHPTYNPENDTFLSYADQYIQENGSYYGITASDIYDIRTRYGLYRTSQTTGFGNIFISFVMVGAIGGASNNSTAIQNYWPKNNGFVGEPTTTYLLPGTIVDRYGYPGGSFVSPIGTPFEMRGLPPQSANAPYNVYEVLQPFEVQAGTTTPAFGYLGGGTQYMTPVSIQILLDKGILGIIR